MIHHGKMETFQFQAIQKREWFENRPRILIA